MIDINQFIKSAAADVGTDENSASRATSGLLGMIRDQVNQNDLSELLERIPGAEALLDATPRAASASAGDSGGPGGLGRIVGKVAGAFGGSGRGLASLAGLSDASGLDLKQIAGLANSFLSLAGKQGGSDLVSRILNQMPDLRQLAD